MRTDNVGQVILDEIDICDIYLRDPERIKTNIFIERPINLHRAVEIQKPPQLTLYQPTDETVEQFDERLQQNWLMPASYKEMDIAAWVLDQCATDAERQRVGQELLLYLERDLFPLLQYLKYLVDTMREHNVVWGVGRGSSTASYVLFLIGVHKIDSMYFDLDITEFLR